MAKLSMQFFWAEFLHVFNRIASARGVLVCGCESDYIYGI
jgi:hypothetical protein